MRQRNMCDRVVWKLVYFVSISCCLLAANTNVLAWSESMWKVSDRKCLDVRVDDLELWRTDLLLNQEKCPVFPYAISP